MEITFSQAKEFENIIKMVSGLLEEAVFTLDEDGLKMRSMDPSRVALLDLNIPKQTFEDYQVEEPVELGINVDRFSKILRRGSSGDSLTLRQSTDDSLKVIFKGRAKRSFKLALRDIEDSSKELPDLDHTSKIALYAEILKESIKDASLVGDNLSFEVEEGKFMAKARGNGQQTSALLTEEDDSLIEIEVNEETKSTYGLTYLESIIKPMSKSDIIELKLGSDMPVKIMYPIQEEGELTFVCAPRIENQ